ncbi:MAG TPA: adenylosuccinate synthase, partial [Euryarchaeota archaeon]|nr:adenylosuccinate synthase [Euryarchaeota archaeon]
KKEGYKGLPEKAREYVEFISEFIGVPISLISYGPKRSETILLEELF